MDIREHIKEKGRWEGRQEGMKQGMRQGMKQGAGRKSDNRLFKYAEKPIGHGYYLQSDRPY